MKILQAHKYYRPRDGASNYMLYLTDLLQSDGHEVIPFSMKDKHNLASEYSKYFVSNADLKNPQRLSLTRKLRYAGRILYSLEAKKKISRLLRAQKVDMAHLHNIYHHISPSILTRIKKAGIPIVMTVHDYKLICPNYLMFHHGIIHEEDCEGWYLSCVKNKCFKNNRIFSSLATAEMIFHHKIMRYYERLVDTFIAPSDFIMGKMIEYGMPEKKFVHIPHPVDLNLFKAQSAEDKGYVAFFGRLSEEKGVEVLLRAAARLPDIKFKIVGQGPRLKELKQVVKRRGNENVDFVGYRKEKELIKLYDEARIIVLPSLVYENYPLSVMEAKAMGKIILASRIGGIPEMLPDKLMFFPGDSPNLAKQIEKWHRASKKERSEMGAELRKSAEQVNNPQNHLRRILLEYDKLL